MEKLKTNQKNDTSPMGDNMLLPADVVSKLADEYEEQVELENQYRKEKREMIKKLERLIASSYNKPIYNLIYKAEYGDFRQFCEQVAKELRSRHKAHE